MTTRGRCRCPLILGRVGSLRIWFCKYKTLAPLTKFERLRTLVVAGFPDETLAILSKLQNLQYLSIVHLPNIVDLSPLTLLHHLESLSLSTLPSWDSSGKVTKVVSLDPIGMISSLKYLELFGVVPESRSLSPVERCGSLVSARFSKYPKKEIQRFLCGDRGVGFSRTPTCVRSDVRSGSWHASDLTAAARGTSVISRAPRWNVM